MTSREHRGGQEPVPGLAARLPRHHLPDATSTAEQLHESRKFLDQVRGHVAANRWTAIGCTVGWQIYTVGLTERGWPELVVSMRRFTEDAATWMLTELVGRSYQQQRAPRPGTAWLHYTQVQLSECAVEALPQLCRVACELYGPRVRALRVGFE